MKVERGARSYAPAPALRDRVVSIDVVESAGAEVTILPATAVVFGLQYRGTVRAESGPLAPVGVTGIQTTARRYTYAEGTASILVRFTRQGAACLGVPVSALAHRSVAMADVLSAARARRLHDQVCGATTERERIALLEEFLGELPFARDVLVTRALALLEADGDARRVPTGSARPARFRDARHATIADDARPTIAGVARQLSMSERQLERRFARVVGLSPKQFVTLHRFERALELARAAPSLTEAALAAGYYDQSHFIRDVQRFTGVPPRVLLRDVGFVQAGDDADGHPQRRGSP